MCEAIHLVCNPVVKKISISRLTGMGALGFICFKVRDGWVMVESSDKMWSTGEGNGKPVQYSCLENPMNSMKRQKDMSLKDELPRLVGAQYATGDEQRAITNSARKNEWLGQSRNNIQPWMCLVVKVKPDATNNNIA